MMIQFLQKIMAKSNDNAKEPPPPVMTGNYAVDALALCKHWKLNDMQIGEWMTMPAVYSHRIQNVCQSTMLLKAPQTKKQVIAQDVAMCMGVLNYLFAALHQLPDEESMLILNQMYSENDKFVKERTATKTETV